MKSIQTGIRIAAWSLLLCSITFLTSCKKEQPKSQQPTNNAIKNVTQSTKEITDTNTVIVTVNGKKIRELDVLEQVKPLFDELAKSAAQMPAAMIEQYKTGARQQAIEKLVVTSLLDEKVKEAKIVISDEKLMSELEKALKEEDPPVTLEQYKKDLAERNMDYEQQKEKIRQAIAYEKVLESCWEGKINITDNDANQYYKENFQDFNQPEQVRASHILVGVKKTDSNDVKAAAKAKIEAILAKIKAGADFAEVAKTDSNDPLTAKDGGDLDYFQKGDMVDSFDKAAFALKKGEISDLVETNLGYHIIKITDRKEARIIPFSEAKTEIIRTLTDKKESELAVEYIQSLKDKAKIVYAAGQEPQQ